MQRARRLLHAWHHGLPVAVEITPGADRPQIEQITVVTGRQV